MISLTGFCIFMEQHIKEFIEFKKGGRLNPNSARDYLNSLNKFKSIVKKPLNKVDRTDIIKFRNSLSLKYSPKSIEHHLTVLHAFVAFWNTEIKCISASRIEIPTARSNPRLTVTEEEYRKMLSVLEMSNYYDLQKRLALNILWDCGCRLGELCSINLEDMDFENRKIRIDTEKTKKERVLFWSEETEKTMQKFMPIRWEIKRSKALFIGLYKTGEYSDRIDHGTVETWFERMRKWAKIERNITPHSFRHSRIQRWINSGLDLISVTYLSGHESINSLEHYMRLGPAQVEVLARKAM